MVHYTLTRQRLSVNIVGRGADGPEPPTCTSAVLCPLALTLQHFNSHTRLHAQGLAAYWQMAPISRDRDPRKPEILKRLSEP